MAAPCSRNDELGVELPREYPEAPIVGVGALILKGDQILLIQRGRDPDRGRWAIPGGGVELGETLQAAAQREVREECGLEVEIGEIAEVYDLILPDERGRIRFHYVLIDLLARYQGGEPRPGSDAVAVAWASPEHLDEYDIPERLRAVIARVLRTRSVP
jgi:8-oxo-dGTP diphosphatase